MSARSRGATLRQLSNASVAAASAASASALVASATDAIVSPVAGSSTSSVAPPEASRHCPPMKSWVLTPSTTRVSSAVAAICRSSCVRRLERPLQGGLRGYGVPRPPNRRNRGRALLRAAQDRAGRAAEDPEVQPERPAVDVGVVELGALGDAGGAARALDLGQAGQADAHAVAVRVAGDVGGEALDVLGPLGARADEAHVAAHHVPQLGQLVHRGAADEAADGRAAVDALDAAGGRSGGRHEARLVADAHGAELEHPEDLAALADAALAEEDRTARGEPHGEREPGEQREQDDQRDEREAAADEVLALEGDVVEVERRRGHRQHGGGHGDGEGEEEEGERGGHASLPSARRPDLLILTFR